MVTDKVMKNVLLIIAAIVLLFSCSEKKEISCSTDWQVELTGVGYIGTHPDSLMALFSYYPYSNNQAYPHPKYRFQLYPKVSGDTITIPNSLLSEVFSNSNDDQAAPRDSSSFMIGQEGELFKFTKIAGDKIIPAFLYFKKYPTQYPKGSSYYLVEGTDNQGSFTIEVNGNDSLSVWLEGSPYGPYVYEQYKKSDIDDRFIGSYLNLVCDSRYDTITFGGTIFCGVIVDELLVYNDSVFDYSTYFHRIPDGGGVLLNYFRSKVEKETHSLKKFDMLLDCPFEPKRFTNLPVAVENWSIEEPPVE